MVTCLSTMMDCVPSKCEFNKFFHFKAALKVFYRGNKKIKSFQEPIKMARNLLAPSLSHRQPFVHFLSSHEHCGPDKKWVPCDKFMIMTQSISKEEPDGLLHL